MGMQKKQRVLSYASLTSAAIPCLAGAGLTELQSRGSALAVGPAWCYRKVILGQAQDSITALMN